MSKLTKKQKEEELAESWRRTVRAFLQAFVTALLTSGVLSSVQESGVVDWSALKKVGISALFAGILAAFVLAQTTLESLQVIPAILRKVPSKRR